jgi:DNA modification methylase
MNLQHKTWPISRLIEYENNPRKNDHAVDKIASAIEAFGFRIPVVARSDGTVVDGHLRLKAARLLGMTKIPVVLADDLSDAQIKAFRISVNKMAELADWDEDLLRAELLDLQGIEFDMDLLGFDVETLEDLLYIEPERDDSKDDEVPEAPAIPVSKLGDVWLLGKHRVMCGDSTRIEAVNKLMDGKKADMVFADPPYGMGVVKNNKVGADFGVAKKGQYSDVIGDDNKETAQNFYNTCVALGYERYIIWGGNYFVNFLPFSSGWIIWDKRGDTGIKNTFADGEMAWTNIQRQVRIYKQLWNGMIREGEHEERVHPTQKPIMTLERILGDFTEKYDTIFDGFLGSGSTLIAAEKTNRICYGLELSPHYVDVIVNRWQTYTGNQAILEATGQTFDELAEAANV